MDAEAWGGVEQQLVALCRSAGPLRAARAAISEAFVRREAWKQLGCARLSDYADEHLGCSARSVLDIARAGRCFRALPRLRDALVSGELGWTKVRQLVRVVRFDDLETWIAYACEVTSDALSREVRKVDVGSVERGGHAPDRSRSHLFLVECTPDVRLQWRQVYLQAQRVHGGRLRTSDFAEMLAAETLSAVPLEHDVELEAALDASTRSDTGAAASGTGSGGGSASASKKGTPKPDLAEVRPQDEPRSPLPPELQALVEGLEDADAADLDRRMHLVVQMERQRDAEIGPLLEQVIRRRLYWRLGYASRETYARDRLGTQASWMRELLRIERAARASPSLAAAYREGRLTALQAATLAPLVFAELDEGQVARWVRRAARMTLRRLRDDVEDAITLCDTDFDTWCRTGGLPADAPEADASEADVEASGDGPADAARQIRARHTHPFEKCAVMCSLEPAVRRLLQAVLCTVRRYVERETGVLPTKGQALGLILDHAYEAWGGDLKEAKRDHAVFARDGWRCAVPGCTSMRNLHGHHIAFRSAGGGDELENRVTLCVFHHLRGVHAGLIRVTGRAPGRLRFVVGVRPDGPPLAVYDPGDRLVETRGAAVA